MDPCSSEFPILTVCKDLDVRRGWNYSQTLDIFRAFVALVWTKIDVFCQTVRMTNAHGSVRACVIAMHRETWLGARLARGYTASKCSSRYPMISYHEEKSIILPDGNVALLRNHFAVGKPRYCLTLAIVLAHPFLECFVLHFPLLGWLFPGGCCETSIDIVTEIC